MNFLYFDQASKRRNTGKSNSLKYQLGGGFYPGASSGIHFFYIQVDGPLIWGGGGNNVCVRWRGGGGLISASLRYINTAPLHLSTILTLQLIGLLGSSSTDSGAQ